MPQPGSHPPELLTRSPLDPDDWEAFRANLMAAADRLVNHVRDQRHWPVWQEMPDSVADALLDPVTAEGLGAERAWEILEDRILPYGVGNLHPRFMGWVHGAGTPGGLIAGLAEAAINANVGGRNTGAAEVERAVLAWARDLFGFPDSSSGILTSGTSMATVIALSAARQATAEWDIEKEGLGTEGARFRAYASQSTHSCVANALRLLGFGSQSLRTVPVDAEGRILVERLREMVEEDRASGLRPFAVVGNAGTVDIGAVDDLTAIADFAAQEQLWFHVDGAFGALLRLSPRLRDRVRSIDRADSIAFDFHKWLHVTYDCGCVLIREREDHRAAFAGRPRYLEGQARGLAAGEPWFCDYGPELSRSFRALRVWFLLAEHGTDALAEAIEGSVERAAHMAARVVSEPTLELMAPARLNIVCFRVRPQGDENSDELNTRVVAELQKRGIAAPSTTRLGDGVLAIRCCLMNHRANLEDMDVTIDGVLQIVEEMRRDQG